MPMKSKCMLLLALIIYTQQGYGQTNNIPSVLKNGSQVEKLSGDFIFTEGPASDSGGNVFFTDQPNDRIMLWSTKDELSTYMQPSGRSNGLYFDSRGNLWSCADEKNELWSISPDKQVTVVLNSYNDRTFNGPNDLWIAKNGDVYFTDPYYKRTWWDHSAMPQDRQCVYYLSADRKTFKRVADDMVQPNGIVGSLDGKTLFVADIGDRKTWAYTINKDGSLGNKNLFCEMGSDGMTTDRKGNLYLTGKGVTVFDKTGKELGNIAVPENWTANVCFGGRNHKTLFITASKGLYRIRTRMKGI